MIRMIRTILAAALLPTLAACASGTNGTPSEQAGGGALLQLGQETWDGFQAYLKSLDSTQRGAFAIAEGGNSAFADRYCQATACADTTQIEAEAIAACENSGSNCMVFAVNRDTRIPYRTPQ